MKTLSEAFIKNDDSTGGTFYLMKKISEMEKTVALVGKILAGKEVDSQETTNQTRRKCDMEKFKEEPLDSGIVSKIVNELKKPTPSYDKKSSNEVSQIMKGIQKEPKEDASSYKKKPLENIMSQIEKVNPKD